METTLERLGRGGPGALRGRLAVRLFALTIRKGRPGRPTKSQRTRIVEEIAAIRAGMVPAQMEMAA